MVNRLGPVCAVPLCHGGPFINPIASSPTTRRRDSPVLKTIILSCAKLSWAAERLALVKYGESNPASDHLWPYLADRPGAYAHSPGPLRRAAENSPESRRPGGCLRPGAVLHRVLNLLTTVPSPCQFRLLADIQRPWENLKKLAADPTGPNLGSVTENGTGGGDLVLSGRVYVLLAEPQTAGATVWRFRVSANGGHPPRCPSGTHPECEKAC